MVLDTNVVVSALIARGVPRELFLLGENRGVRSDPDDNFVIATAAEAEADILVSGDKGVLEHHPHRGIQILRPADALRHVRAVIGK